MSNVEIPVEERILLNDSQLRPTTDVGEAENELAADFYGDRKDDGTLKVDINEGGDLQVPMSPGQRLIYYAGSPGRYVKREIRPGSVKSSVFSLVIICLGAGTITIPYTFYALGFILGSFAVMFGGTISIFAGWMLAHACYKTKATCYEECAMVSFGKNAQYATSVCMIACNAGFLLSYIVLFKSFMPYSIQLATGKRLPSWCDDSFDGQMIWAVFFCFVITPLSVPRELSALRFTSAFSVMVSFYIVLVIFFECVLCNGTSPTVGEGFAKAHQQTDVKILTIFNCLPLIIFAFMYQINIPAIYSELEEKTMKGITNVLTFGTVGAGCLYVITGIFGLVAFAACGPQGYPMNDKKDPPEPWTYKGIFEMQNILQAPYFTENGKTPVAIYVCLFGILIVVTFASPFCVLPMKDSIEEVRGKGKLEKNPNIGYTVLICAGCGLLSFGLTSLGTVATLLGATTNSAIGFFLPIMFYLKVEKNSSKWTNTKIAAYLLFGFVAFSSCMTLGLMLQRAIKGDGGDK